MVARLLYRDGLMLVLDKPAGMAVHRGPKGGESLEDHFDALRFGLPRAPALAHRLDRDTSGCLVLGRHRKALAALGKMFKTGKIGKTYWAVVEGGPEADEGTHRHPARQTRRDARLVDEAGRCRAGRGDDVEGDGTRGISLPRLRGRVREGANFRAGDCSLPPPRPSPASGRGRNRESPGSRMEPITGRTHQLRVHAAEMGWPIIGDSIYGKAPRTGGPILHLHSREIVVPISKNKPPVAVVAPVPEHMRERLAACGWKETDPPSPSP